MGGGARGAQGGRSGTEAEDVLRRGPRRAGLERDGGGHRDGGEQAWGAGHGATVQEAP